MSAMGGDQRVGARERRSALAMVPELLLLLFTVGALATLGIRWLEGPNRERPAVAVTVPSTPTTVRGRFSLLTGTKGEIRITLEAHYDGPHKPARGSVVHAAKTYVTHGRFLSLRTGPGAAVVGVTGTTVYPRSGQREARSGVIVLAARRGSATATYQLDRGRARPNCSSASFEHRLPIVGRFVASRR